jgi:hypothetical protein
MYTSLSSRWAAIGAAVAVTLGAGGLVGVDAADDVSSLVPITPVRILDTRSGDRVGSLDAAGNSTPHRLKVTGSPGIPASGVTGVSLNVTAVDTQANEYGGFVTVYPCTSTTAARPDVSNLNFVSGQTLANSVTVPVSADGHVCIYVYGTAHILADASGYYTGSAPDPVDAYTRGETDTLIDTKADQTDLDTLETTVDTFQGLPAVPVTVDTTGNAGVATSIAIGLDGNPVISYFDGNPNFHLKVAACTNPTCTTSTITTIDTTGNGDLFTSIAIGVDGNPVIAYYDAVNRDLKVAVCTNPTCTNSTIRAIDTTGDVGSFTSIAIGVDGNPVIAYQDTTSTNLKVAACNSPTCTTSTRTAIDTAGDVGYDTSIAIGADGNPIISHYDMTSTGDLKVAACNNPTCTSSTNSLVDATVNDAGSFTSIAIGANGNPIISFYDANDTSLGIATCADPTCSTSSTTAIDSTGDVGYETSIAIGVDGNPVISYYDATNENLKAAVCGDPTCSTSSTATIDTPGNVGSSTSIAIGTNGIPVISYRDFTNTDLKVASLWWATGGR